MDTASARTAMKHDATSGLGKAAAALCAGLCCIFMANAHAQPDHRQHERREARRDFRDSRWSEARDPRQFEGRAEEARRLPEENRDNADAPRRMGRMTQEERRDLRRQINEAGQQVYAQPPRR